ncbi:hypothetical protein V6N11_014059 [Hibiscus sabdariffa]|uniref:Uncharacterized protein n=1 Tax=Hibiscus sabdariffa TaxID=183260 RepID=A0ABR2AFW7_9ROSI
MRELICLLVQARTTRLERARGASSDLLGLSKSKESSHSKLFDRHLSVLGLIRRTTLGKLKKGAASIRLLSLFHSERKKKALLCLLPSSLIESKTHTSAYESYGFLTFSGNRFSPVLAGPCSNNILLVHYHLRSSAIRMLPTTRLRLMICIAVASGPRRELSLGISSVYTDSLTAIDEGMVRLSFPSLRKLSAGYSIEQARFE